MRTRPASCPHQAGTAPDASSSNGEPEWQRLAAEQAASSTAELWRLPCISASHLLSSDAEPGPATIPRPDNVAAPAALADIQRPRLPPRPLPRTNVPPQAPPPAALPDPHGPDRFAEAMRLKLRKTTISLDDIYMPRAHGKAPLRLRIAKWLRAAKDYHASVLAAAQRGGVRLKRRPRDWAIPLEELLRPECRPFVWDTRDPDDVFPMREDSAPFASDTSVQLDTDWLTEQAARLGFPDADLIAQLKSGISGNHTEPCDRTTLLCCNSASYAEHALETEAEVDDEMRKQWSSLHAGDALPFAPVKLSPQGSVPKNRYSAKRRRTSNLSKSVPHSAENSVNRRFRRCRRQAGHLLPGQVCIASVLP